MQQQNRVTFYRNASFFCLHFGFVETAKLFGKWFGLFEMKLSLACFMAFHVHKIKMYTQEKCVFVKKDSIVTKSMSKVHIITLFWKNLEVEYLMFADLKFAKFQKWQSCYNNTAWLAG